MYHQRSRVALGATIALTLAAATVTAAGTLVPASAGLTAGPVEVSIDANRMVTMPDTIAPGVTTFHVTSAKVSSFQLVLPVDGYTKDQAANDVARGLGAGKVKAIRRFEAHVTLYGGGLATPTRPATVSVDLPAGTYWALDTNAPPAADYFHTFTVSGTPTGATMPAPTATVRAKNDADWAKRPHSIPHRGTLAFHNASTDNHFVEMVKLRKGKTYADFKHWLRQVMNGKNAKPPLNERRSYEGAVVSPGHTVQTNYRLPRGDYVMLCWWPDADMGGMPHVFMGMHRAITLT